MARRLVNHRWRPDMFDPQDTSRPPLSDSRRGSATDRADLDDERGWWKSPPAGGSARCEAPVDVLHRTPSFYRQGYRVGKQGYSAPRSSVSLGRLMAPPGASDRSTGRTGGASGPSATCPRVCSPSLAQNCATLRISGFRRLVGDDAEVNVDTGFRAAESCRPS